jgi:hypothetical protein
LALLPDLVEDRSCDRQQEQANKPSLHIVLSFLPPWLLPKWRRIPAEF